MRCSFVLCLLSLTAATSFASAQEKPKDTKDRLVIERIRVGLPDGRNSDQGRIKTGSWVPVYIDVTVGPEDIPANNLALVVETADSDGILNQYTQTVPFILPKKQTVNGLQTYVRPGSFGGEINVTLLLGGKQFARQRVTPDFSGIVENGGVLWLTLGSKLPGLRLGLSRKAVVLKTITAMVTFGNNGFHDTITRNDGGDWSNDGFVVGQTIRVNGNGNNNGSYTIQNVIGATLEVTTNGAVTLEGPVTKSIEAIPEDDSMDSEFRKYAAIDSLDQMPRNWFGYQAVDVMVLTSSDERFIQALIADQSGRTRALVDWVRRGGRLIITAAANQQLVSKLLTDTALMNCTLTGSVRRPSMPEFSNVASSQKSFEAKAGIEVAKITAGPGVELLDDKLRTKDGLLLAVQSACGLGHVILVACDLDAPPFAAWQGQGEFWRYLQLKMEPRLAVREENINPGMRMNANQTNELAAQMQNTLEKFGDITVISFGWVALFILIYIIIVGPLDYLFLKKVLKRLELTWITFPVVVITVSAAAYFTAYYLKGNDLKINKLDVVDIDLAPALDPAKPPPRIYGSTWFTLFSPRIQHYTIGLEAADGGWGGGGRQETLVGWMGRPENSYGGMGRGGAQSLFRRTYDYEPEAAGLTGVPIQVWATKSFSASWVVQPPNDQAPMTADLKHPPADVTKVSGTVISNLPAPLVDVVAIYKGNAHAQTGPLYPDVPHRLEFGGSPVGIKEWMGKPLGVNPRPTGSPVDDLAAWSTGMSMKSILFGDSADTNQGKPWSNTGLRHLDQSWRMKDRDEVILIGRMEPRIGEGKAEDVTIDPATPSRLWLGTLPGSGPRPKLEGTMTQRTIVRVYIPVNK
jgi:hypothetical protein